jgi:hypothetical protein
MQLLVPQCNNERSKYLQTADSNRLAVRYNPINRCINQYIVNKKKKNIPSIQTTFQLQKAEPYNPIWTISDLYLPIVGYYDRAKFRADDFSRSGRVRV